MRAVLLISLVCSGCATTMAHFEEVDSEGTYTEFHQRNLVTLGSKLEQGAGNMLYKWSEEGGEIAVGNAAKGAEAGTGAELVNAIAALLAPYTAVLEALVAPDPPALIEADP